MSDNPADVDLDIRGENAPIEPEPPRKLPVVPIVGLVLLLALAGGYLYLRAPSRSDAPAASAPGAGKPAGPAAKSEPPVALPPLDETDPIVRELIGQLSKHPIVAAWLANDGLIMNFALVTQRIASGASPAKEVGTLPAVPAFKPATSRKGLMLDPASYRRYDRYAEAVGALDARGTAALYTRLKPRILDAYRRMKPQTGSGDRGSAADFDPVLERAIAEMLAVPVVRQEIALVPHGIGYAFADPGLENLSAAQKHLLRMGPDNVQTIQSKLREIADYLGIPSSRLPRPVER